MEKNFIKIYNKYISKIIPAKSTVMMKISNARSQNAFFLLELAISLLEIFSKNIIIFFCINKCGTNLFDAPVKPECDVADSITHVVLI